WRSKSAMTWPTAGTAPPAANSSFSAPSPVSSAARRSRVLARKVPAEVVRHPLHVAMSSPAGGRRAGLGHTTTPKVVDREQVAVAPSIEVLDRPDTQVDQGVEGPP